MENKNKNIQQQFDSMAIEFSRQMRQFDVEPLKGKEWVTNGIDNSNYRLLMDAYDDSPTNSSIINGFSTYTFADGIIDRNGEIIYNNEGKEVLNTKRMNVEKIISRADGRLITLQYYKLGGYAIQIIWNSAKNEEDKRPVKIKYFPLHKLALNVDEFYNTTGYWYSFDWCQKSKYKPILLPKFDGTYKGHDVEILIVNRPTDENFFAKPLWFSGLQYALLEGELQTSSYAHVINGFQAGKMINFNNGVPSDENVKIKIKQDLTNNFRGSEKTNQFFVTWNNGRDNAPEIVDMGVPQVNEQYVYFSEEAQRRLIDAHSASPIIFSNTKIGNGLSNNADEIEMATAMMYRKTINPNREVILDGLQYVFNFIDEDVKLDFKDFETFGGDKRDQVSNDNIKKFLNTNE